MSIKILGFKEFISKGNPVEINSLTVMSENYQRIYYNYNSIQCFKIFDKILSENHEKRVYNND